MNGGDLEVFEQIRHSLFVLLWGEYNAIIVQGFVIGEA